MKKSFLFISLVYLVGLAINPVCSISEAAARYKNIGIFYPGPPQQKWMQPYYSGLAQCEGKDIKVDTSGNVYTTGWCWTDNLRQYDIVTIKYDRNGQQKWVQTYHGNGIHYDMGKKLVLDPLGNVYVAGLSDGDNIVLKYDPAGNLLWTQRSPNSAFNMNNSDRNIQLDGLGNVYTSYSTAFLNGADIVLVKYTSAGVPLWSRSYSSPYNIEEFARGMTVVSNSAVYITGTTVKSCSSSGCNSDVLSLKYDANGNLLWVREFGNVGTVNDESGFKIFPDSAGNIYVAGWSHNSSVDGVVLKYNSLGNLLWSYTYNSPVNFHDAFVDAGIDAQGNIYATGQTQKTPWPVPDINYITVKINSLGGQVWAKEYAGPGGCSYDTDYGRALAVDAIGNVYVTGDECDANELNIVTLSYDTAGNELWRLKYTAGVVNYANALTLDSNNNIYVEGQGLTSPYSFLTIKYGY